METEHFAYVWEYRIRPSRRVEFLAAYDASGDWVRLFSRDPAYLGTKLLRDTEHDDRYLTIDYWQSKGDRDSFRARYSQEFDELDRRCESFTKQERFLGDFVDLGAT